MARWLSMMFALTSEEVGALGRAVTMSKSGGHGQMVSWLKVRFGLGGGPGGASVRGLSASLSEAAARLT